MNFTYPAYIMTIIHIHADDNADDDDNDDNDKNADDDDDADNDDNAYKLLLEYS